MSKISIFVDIDDRTELDKANGHLIFETASGEKFEVKCYFGSVAWTLAYLQTMAIAGPSGQDDRWFKVKP